MKYLPIMQELLGSDTVVIFCIGAVAALILGLIMDNRDSRAYAVSCSLGLYLLSELLSNIRLSFLPEIALVFVGTIALGAFIGFAVSFIIKAITKR